MCASVSSMYHILWKHNLKGEPCQYHNCLAELNHWSNYKELGFFRASLNPNYNHNSKVDYQRELKGHFRIIIPSKYQQQSKELLSSSAHCPWNSSVVIRCPQGSYDSQKKSNNDGHGYNICLCMSSMCILSS